jgi:hypothetical protein
MSTPSPVPKSTSKSLHIITPPFCSPSSILFFSLLLAPFFKIKYQIPPQQQPCAIIHQKFSISPRLGIVSSVVPRNNSFPLSQGERVGVRASPLSGCVLHPGRGRGWGSFLKSYKKSDFYSPPNNLFTCLPVYPFTCVPVYLYTCLPDCPIT